MRPQGTSKRVRIPIGATELFASELVKIESNPFEPPHGWSGKRVCMCFQFNRTIKELTEILLRLG